MKVSELGEFGLIDLLAKMADGARDKEKGAWQQLILGIGDDAAAWRGDTSIQLATVDSLIEDVHFSLEMSSWEELGWRALAANLSDIAAMGGLPRYALVSLALPGHTETGDVTALHKGMMALAQQFGVAITGEDVRSAQQLVINITVLGNTGSRDKHILTRSAATVGDKVAVTGYLGAAAAGLEVLTEHLRLGSEAEAVVKKAFLQPYPRVVEGQVLVEHGVKTAIDISDGLNSDLKHICQASRVSARIEVDYLSVQPAVRANFEEMALELALSEGEDYELLFTAGAGIIDKIKAAVSSPVTVIGEVITGKTDEVTLVDEKGNPVSLPEPGWEYFRIK